MRYVNERQMDVLTGCSLFRGVEREKARAMLECLSARARRYGRGEFIQRAGERPASLGVVAEGKATVMREDYWGNCSVMTLVGPGELFSEVFACLPDVASAVNVVADEPTTVVFLDIAKVIARCASACPFHERVTNNLVAALARKNLMVTERLDHVTRHTTREKLLAYLSAVARRSGSNEFVIPMNRQQLADYLSVDRSAMSAELGRMREDGLVEFSRNRFRLLSGEHA